MPTLEEIEAKMFTEENLKAMEYLWENLKVVNRVLLNMKNSEKMMGAMTKTEIASWIGATVKEVEFNNVNLFTSEEQRDYFLNALREEGYGTTPTYKFLGWNGKKLEHQYRLSASTMRIKGKKVTVKPYIVVVEHEGLKFVLMPQGSIGYGRDEVNGLLWVCCRSSESSKVLALIDDLHVKLDPIKGNVVIVGGSMFEVIDLKEKFRIDQVVVTDYIRYELDLIAGMFNSYKDLRAQDVPFKRGVLFAGPPGTGKTTVTTALAKKVIENGGTVFIFSSTQKVSFQQLYQFADQFQPSLIILEDYDLIAADRGMHDCSSASADLLNVLEGNLGTEGVITVATTNRLDVLDGAATRHGRIDKIYAVDLPSIGMKKDLLGLHLDFYDLKIKLSDAVKALREFLEKGISGAAISSVVLSARQKAVIEKREVTIVDLMWAAEGTRKTNGKLGF